MGACTYTMAPCNCAGKLWLERPEIISPQKVRSQHWKTANMKKEWKGKENATRDCNRYRKGLINKLTGGCRGRSCTCLLMEIRCLGSISWWENSNFGSCCDSQNFKIWKTSLKLINFQWKTSRNQEKSSSDSRKRNLIPRTRLQVQALSWVCCLKLLEASEISKLPKSLKIAKVSGKKSRKTSRNPFKRILNPKRCCYEGQLSISIRVLRSRLQ